MILLTTVVILSNILTATISASIPDDHCFDHDLENSFSYEPKSSAKWNKKMT